jgi:hypothetical protein
MSGNAQTGSGRLCIVKREAAALGAVREIEVPRFDDPRGQLTAFERSSPLPFTPVRAFVIADVPRGMHRAEHIVSCDQFLWMAAGACQVVVRQGSRDVTDGERRFRLTGRASGLYLPEGVWLDLSEFSPGSMLLCLAAATYDAQAKR